MVLGFYYHLPLHSSIDGFSLPAYLGLFLDSVAKEVDKLILFLHEAGDEEKGNCEYLLKAKNIHYVNLGRKTSAWHRFLFPARTLKRSLGNAIEECDFLLVRAPSPLAPAFYSRFRKKTTVVLMIVGDYLDGVKFLHQPFLRKRAIQLLSKRNDRQLRRVLGRTPSIVNSVELYEKYRPLSPELQLIRTTTISSDNIFIRTDTCTSNEINVLYTGRLDIAKGLRELIQGVATLIKERYNIRLNIVGWEDNKSKPIEKLLLKLANENGIMDRIDFHGRLTLDPDLFRLYRQSDIYVIPSYHEGFPRSIWEAMASGLPVIATRVGSIPSFVNDAALIIEPQDHFEISNAIRRLIEDPNLRKNLIKEGYKKAMENTLEIRTKEITDILKSYRM